MQPGEVGLAHLLQGLQSPVMLIASYQYLHVLQHRNGLRKDRELSQLTCVFQTTTPNLALVSMARAACCLHSALVVFWAVACCWELPILNSTPFTHFLALIRRKGKEIKAEISEVMVNSFISCKLNKVNVFCIILIIHVTVFEISCLDDTCQ